MISAISLYTTTSKPTLKVKVLVENDKILTRGSDQATGYDIYSSKTISILQKKENW